MLHFVMLGKASSPKTHSESGSCSSVDRVKKKLLASKQTVFRCCKSLHRKRKLKELTTYACRKMILSLNPKYGLHYFKDWKSLVTTDRQSRTTSALLCAVLNHEAVKMPKSDAATSNQ